MPKGLRRIHGGGDFHFITCSCYRRLALLKSARRRNVFLEILEQVGSVTGTVNGIPKSVTYNRFSTQQTIAGALATAINNDLATGVTATVSNNVITLEARISGASTNYSLSVASQSNNPEYFNPPSFSATPSGSSLTGGSDSTQNQAPNMNTPYVTWYAYDVLDNLTSVNMGAQTRTYNYDSLGRLTSSTTPESRTVSFTYHDFGKVNTRTDARGVVSTYSYDGLRRLQTISYNDGTIAAWFGYDGGGAAANGNGRMTSTFQNPPIPTFVEGYVYDPMGRTLQHNRNFGGTNYNIVYTYNAAGQVATMQYPSGRIVTYEYDNIGRLNKVKNDGADMLTIPDSTGYNAASQPLSVTYGNGVNGTFTYNNNLQLASLRYQKPSMSDLLNLAYEYVAPNGGNNGQISKIRFHTAPGVEDLSKTEVFQYDAWSRLANAQTQDTNPALPNTWALTWQYDRYGNRLNQTLTAGSQSVTQPQLQISTATNRITTAGFSYDNAGNLTNDAIHTYAYDAENRIKTMDSTAASYSYDNGGLRLRKNTGGNATTYIYSGSKVIAEYLNGALSKEYIYAGSQLLATIAGSSTTYSYADHLSVRARADASGNSVGTSGHLPFGDVWYETGTADKWKFTSYERDTESNLDYAIMRYDSSRLGRFMSADRLAGSIRNPQTLNRYVYAVNNPVNSIDPLGLEPRFFFWLCRMGAPMTVIFHDDGEPHIDPILNTMGRIVCDMMFMGPFESPAEDSTEIVGQRIADLLDILKNDPKCLEFLNRKGGNAQQLLSGILDAHSKDPSLGFGVTTIPPVKNPDGTLTITNALSGGYIVGQNITVNSIGAFFKSSYDGMRVSADRERFTGGTKPAQLFTLLHETGHLTEALVPDRNNQGNVDKNDKTLEKECKDSVKAISKAK